MRGACDDCGFMFNIASLQPCQLTEAACSLVNGPWRGVPTLFSLSNYDVGGYRGRWCLDGVRMSNEAPLESNKDITLLCCEDRFDF